MHHKMFFEKLLPMPVGILAFNFHMKWDECPSELESSFFFLFLLV